MKNLFFIKKRNDELNILSANDTFRSKFNPVMKTYFSTLKVLLKNPRANNIAMTGDLGIGKSSILRSYERENHKRFAYISANDLSYTFQKNIENVTNVLQSEHLCSIDSERDINLQDICEEKNIVFDSNESSSESKVNLNNEHNFERSKNQYNSNDVQAELENSILNQLFSMCYKKDVSDSNFSLIPENPSGIIWNIIGFILLVFDLFIVFFSRYIINICDEIYVAFNIEKIGIDVILFETFTNNFILIAKIILPLLVSIFIGDIVYTLIRNYKKPSFELKKSNGDDEASIKLNSKDDKNLKRLDTNIPEIVYLLESIGKKVNHVLVIEDLDRFDSDICIPILVKLKQINAMINNRYKYHDNKFVVFWRGLIKKEKTFKFIYVLKDNVFGGNDPYKFFDVICPVVPVLGTNNVNRFLEKRWAAFNLDVDFVSCIAKHLLDFRKMLSIENEYNIFKNIYDKNEITKIKGITNNNLLSVSLDKINERTELMAFVIYKNIEPNDYYKMREYDNYGNSKSVLLQHLQNREKVDARDVLYTSDVDNMTLIDILENYMTLNVCNYIGVDYCQKMLATGRELVEKAQYNVFNSELYESIKMIYSCAYNYGLLEFVYLYCDALYNTISYTQKDEPKVFNDLGVLQKILNDIGNLWIDEYKSVRLALNYTKLIRLMINCYKENLKKVSLLDYGSFQKNVMIGSKLYLNVCNLLIEYINDVVIEEKGYSSISPSKYEIVETLHFVLTTCSESKCSNAVSFCVKCLYDYFDGVDDLKNKTKTAHLIAGLADTKINDDVCIKVHTTLINCAKQLSNFIMTNLGSRSVILLLDPIEDTDILVLFADILYRILCFVEFNSTDYNYVMICLTELEEKCANNSAIKLCCSKARKYHEFKVYSNEH